MGLGDYIPDWSEDSRTEEYLNNRDKPYEDYCRVCGEYKQVGFSGYCEECEDGLE